MEHYDPKEHIPVEEPNQEVDRPQTAVERAGLTEEELAENDDKNDVPYWQR